MPRQTLPEFFIQALAELRDEQREVKKNQLRANIRSYVDRLVRDFRIEFDERPESPALIPVQHKSRPHRISHHSDK